MKRVILAVWAACSLAGCAASGVQVTEEQAQSFQTGKATYADVVAALGPPTASVSQSNGTRIVVYSYAAVQSRPQNFIPYIGPLVSGYDSQSSAVTFTFDARGILTNTTSTQTGIGAGANLAAGPSRAAPTQQQPR